MARCLSKSHTSSSPEQIAQTAQETGFSELPVTSGHAAKITGLPLYHHDPFDRLLVVQTLLMPARLLATDAALTPYSGLIWLI